MDDLEQLRLLGRGAMGSVHLMRRAADGAQFALKKIAIPTHEDREVALQEVRIMQRLRHAHIVCFEDATTSPATGELHILMEFCPKGDLGALLERQRRADITSRTTAVDLLNRSLLTDMLPVQALRSIGLYLASRVAPLRRMLMREGIAPVLARPKLMRGLTLGR